MVARRSLATPAEVAEFCQVPERTLEEWRRRKTGPRWIPVGRHVRYHWGDVEKWLDQRAAEAAA